MKTVKSHLRGLTTQAEADGSHGELLECPQLSLSVRLVV